MFVSGHLELMSSRLQARLRVGGCEAAPRRNDYDGRAARIIGGRV